MNALKASGGHHIRRRSSAAPDEEARIERRLEPENLLLVVDVLEAHGNHLEYWFNLQPLEKPARELLAVDGWPPGGPH